MIERACRMLLDDTLFCCRRRWRLIRWLPWALLAMLMVSVLTSGLRGPA